MTSRRVMALIWIVILFCAQQTVGVFFPGWTAPFMLIGVIYYAMTEGPAFGAISGCLAGFLLDVLGVGKLGISMAILSALGVVAGFSASKIFYDGFLTQFLWPLAGNFFFCFFCLLFSRNVADPEGVSSNLFKDSLALSQPILTALVSPFIFSWMKKVGKRT